MREKRWQLIITFSSTVQAMAMERSAQKAGLPGRLIPVPTSITAGCGLAYKAPPEAREDLEQLMKAEGVQAERVVELLL